MVHAFASSGHTPSIGLPHPASASVRSSDEDPLDLAQWQLELTGLATRWGWKLGNRMMDSKDCGLSWTGLAVATWRTWWVRIPTQKSGMGFR